MQGTGKFRNWGMALCAGVLLLPWQSFSQNQATQEAATKIDILRQTPSASSAKASDFQTGDTEFRDILRTVDQLEEHLSGNFDLVSKLRGKLNQHERGLRQQNYQLSTSVRSQDALGTPSARDVPRVRRGGDWSREPAPGSNMYSSCEGLRDKALVTQLREISNYQMGVDYREARRIIFTQLDNHGGQVECVYTGRKGSYNAIPSDRDMNVEHSWPQSQGAVGVAKSDLHHLFPTDSKANSTRSSMPYGKVSNPTWEGGGSKCDGDVFEVRPEQRGNTARAKFYFAVRYGKSIGNEEEAVLRQWSKEDPVDEGERERNNKIENVQHNRNPFVDHPEFVDQINDF